MSNENATVDYRNRYGAVEVNGLENPNAYFDVDRVEVELSDKRLKAVTRLRLLTDPGFPFWDLSYCHGVLQDGTPVRVRLPRYQFSKRNIMGEIIEMCKAEGVYAKGLGLLDRVGVWSTVR